MVNRRASLGWLLALGSTLVWAQPAAWYGLPLPPPSAAHDVPALIGDRGPAPARFPPEEAGFAELVGERLHQDLRTLVGFSHQSLASRELNSSQIWGRVSGFPSEAATAAWVAQQFRDAGIAEVREQSLRQDSNASLWLAESWEVRLLAHAGAGPGSQDVVFDTAVALAPSEIAGGSLTAPVVFVGTGSPAELAHIDVRDKIAIQVVTPQAHLVFERDVAMPRARQMMAQGAVAVLNIIELPGNEMARDMSGCGGPCFNLGGRDGRFLMGVINAATEDGTADELRMQLTLQAREHRGLEATNVVAVIPGASREVIVLNAHVDAWYDGAGDNGDGVAVLLGLARHFAQPAHALRRTLVLVASAGHHTPGLNGPRAAVAMNADLFADALLIVNIEHVAQRNLVPARSVYPDGYRQYVADAGEAPIVAGITHTAPYLESLVAAGVQRYGTNFVSAPSTMASGEGGGYRSTNVPIFTAMQAPPLYHTSGEVIEVISVPGLERMARFMAYFVDQVDRAKRSQIAP